MDNGINSSLDITGTVHNNRSITRTYTDCRFSGWVSSFNHAGTAGSQNYINCFHQFIGKFNGRFFNASDDSFRCACFYSCFIYDLCSFCSTFLCTWMRADQDGISCFQTDQTFENCSGSRVRSRNNRTYKTNRLCDFLDSIRFIFFDHTTGLYTFVSVKHIFGSVMVLDNFVFYYTHTGFGNGHLCQWNTCFIRSHCSFKENFVYLLLSKGCKFFLRLSHSSNLCLKSFYAVDDFRYFGFDFLCHLKSSLNIIGCFV